MTESIDFKAVDQRLLAQALAAVKLLEGMKHDPAGTAITPSYDGDGIFTYPFSNGEVMSAIQQPQSFLDALPLRPSFIRNDVQEVLTWQSTASGNVPDGFCDDPQTPGFLGVCRVVNPIGSLYLGSQKVSVGDVAMKHSYAARPRRMVNGAQIATPLLPDPLRGNFNIESETAIQLMKLATQVRRSLATIECTGDSTHTGGSRRTGWIQEPNGLDNLLVQFTDAVSSENCPAAWPLIETWNAEVGASVNGLTLPQLMHQIYFAKMTLAEDVGYTNPQLTWVMDRRLFYQLVQVFACTYATARCELGDASNPITRMYADIENRRNEMWNGKFLLIDGMRVPVLFTSGAEVDETGSSPVSPIYLVPMRQDGTFIEYYPYNSADVSAFLTEFGGSTVNARPSNNGLYLLANRADGMCFQFLLAAQPRIQIKARFLAARIDDVEYESYVGYRDWNPSGSSFYSGGTSTYDDGL